MGCVCAVLAGFKGGCVVNCKYFLVTTYLPSAYIDRWPSRRGNAMAMQRTSRVTQRARILVVAKVWMASRAAATARGREFVWPCGAKAHYSRNHPKKRTKTRGREKKASRKRQGPGPGPACSEPLLPGSRETRSRTTNEDAIH